MDRIEDKSEKLVTVLRVERRSKNRADLSCEQIMKFARERGRGSNVCQTTRRDKSERGDVTAEPVITHKK